MWQNNNLVLKCFSQLAMYFKLAIYDILISMYIYKCIQTPKICIKMYMYHRAKNFGGKKVWQRKFGRENIGELKSICMRNIMEIVKIGKKTW